MLGEASTTAIVKTKNPKGFIQNKVAACQLPQYSFIQKLTKSLTLDNRD
jgi:hypothetical protein